MDIATPRTTDATVRRMIAVWGQAAAVVAEYKVRIAAAEGNLAAAARWAEIRAAVAVANA